MRPGNARERQTAHSPHSRTRKTMRRPAGRPAAMNPYPSPDGPDCLQSFNDTHLPGRTPVQRDLAAVQPIKTTDLTHHLQKHRTRYRSARIIGTVNLRHRSAARHSWITPAYVRPDRRRLHVAATFPSTTRTGTQS